MVTLKVTFIILFFTPSRTPIAYGALHFLNKRGVTALQKEKFQYSLLYRSEYVSAPPILS